MPAFPPQHWKHSWSRKRMAIEIYGPSFLHLKISVVTYYDQDMLKLDGIKIIMLSKQSHNKGYFLL